MKRFLILVAMFATMSCVTFTSCKKKTEDVKPVKISGNYLCLNNFDFFEELEFTEDGTLTSRGFYGNKSGEEIDAWSGVKGNYKIDGNTIELNFEDGDNDKGVFHLNDHEFIFIDDNDGTTTVYKQLTPDKDICGSWESLNMGLLSDPKVDFFVFPGGDIEPVPTDIIDGTVVKSIVDYLFSDITFMEDGTFYFNHSYDQMEEGTYEYSGGLNLVLTFYVNDIPVNVDAFLAQKKNRDESYIFFDKDGCFKLAILYIYNHVLGNELEVTQQQLETLYNVLNESFDNFAVAVSLKQQ